MEEHERSITDQEKQNAINIIKKYFWFSSLNEFIFYLVIIILILTGHLYGYKAGMNNGVVEVCHNQGMEATYIDDQYACFYPDAQGEQGNNIIANFDGVYNEYD